MTAEFVLKALLICLVKRGASQLLQNVGILDTDTLGQDFRGSNGLASFRISESGPGLVTPFDDHPLSLAEAQDEDLNNFNGLGQIDSRLVAGGPLQNVGILDTDTLGPDFRGTNGLASFRISESGPGLVTPFDDHPLSLAEAQDDDLNNFNGLGHIDIQSEAGGRLSHTEAGLSENHVLFLEEDDLGLTLNLLLRLRNRLSRINPPTGEFFHEEIDDDVFQREVDALIPSGHFRGIASPFQSSFETFDQEESFGFESDIDTDSDFGFLNSFIPVPETPLTQRLTPRVQILEHQTGGEIELPLLDSVNQPIINQNRQPSHNDLPNGLDLNDLNHISNPLSVGPTTSQHPRVASESLRSVTKLRNQGSLKAPLTHANGRSLSHLEHRIEVHPGLRLHAGSKIPIGLGKTIATILAMLNRATAGPYRRASGQLRRGSKIALQKKQPRRLIRRLISVVENEIRTLLRAKRIKVPGIRNRHGKMRKTRGNNNSQRERKKLARQNTRLPEKKLGKQKKRGESPGNKLYIPYYVDSRQGKLIARWKQ